jgi:hypothetical protein
MFPQSYFGVARLDHSPKALVPWHFRPAEYIGRKRRAVRRIASHQCAQAITHRHALQPCMAAMPVEHQRQGHCSESSIAWASPSARMGASPFCESTTKPDWWVEGFNSSVNQPVTGSGPLTDDPSAL